MFFESDRITAGLKASANIKIWWAQKLSFMALSDPIKINATDKKFSIFLSGSSSMLREASELCIKISFNQRSKFFFSSL